MDNSTRGLKCKHIWAIEFAIRMNTLKDVDKLPAEVQVDRSTTQEISYQSYREDDYDF